MKSRSRLVFRSILVLACPLTLNAGTTWDGTGANTNIDTPDNWNDNLNPTLTGSSSTLSFGSGGSTATINTSVNVAGILINRDANFEVANGAGSLTIGSGGITVSLPGTTGRSHTISESNLILGANQSWSVANNTGTAQLTVSSAVDDGASTFGITKSGTGTLVLSGSNGFDGTLTLGSLGSNAGVLRLAHDKAAGDGSISILNGNGDTGVLELTGGINIANNVSFFGRSSSGTGAIFRSVSGNNTLSGVLTGGVNGGNHNFEASSGATLTISNKLTTSVTGRQLNFRGGGTVDISGVIEDTGTGAYAVRLQQGTLTILSGNNSYDGATTTDGSGNVLNIRHANALGSTVGTTTVTANNALQIQGNITTAAEALSLSGSGVANSGALRNISGNNTYSGAITLGSAARIQSDAGTLTLDVAAGNAISATNLGVTFAGAGHIEINDSVNLGSGGLEKTGNGTLTLAAGVTHSYTGATNITQGKLVLNGNISSSLLTSVGDTATLGGSGSTGDLSILNGGTLAPGNSVGSLTIDGDLGLHATSILAFELNPANMTVGANLNDLVSVAGNLTLDGLLSLSATSGDFSAVTGGSWRLFDYSGTLTNNLLTLNSMPSLASGYSWSLDTATPGQVNLAVVPEPRAALLGGLGMLLLLRRRRA